MDGRPFCSRSLGLIRSASGGTRNPLWVGSSQVQEIPLWLGDPKELRLKGRVGPRAKELEGLPLPSRFETCRDGFQNEKWNCGQSLEGVKVKMLQWY